MLLNAVKAFKDGARPPAADNPELYARVRGGYYTTTEPGDWLKLHEKAVTKVREAESVTAGRLRLAASAPSFGTGNDSSIPGL